ncbi:hypothetical protein COU20_00765 [Candidatus Kaiserbacteria bacterium CG10_big_fil_rev_8_21_14_0_10_59_10]|uniref:DUF2914 domain-containing protein n=1 Tax=Candidatus Kaiserbacteria bacterium CG10_big_fil_rev_8_21_14_0_10_59_10 TaxID=1974612 RepID=A0A2H0U8G0_9BACT|nr:MAG: hypothetical protein COU20_00765 [Candidatus Kaiserbacteria bacterium CG10_big_fil_rev_8_21_14_0_10_59_10]
MGGVYGEGHNTVSFSCAESRAILTRMQDGEGRMHEHTDRPLTFMERLRARYRRARELFLRYERRISSISLVTGFILDNIMFSRIQVETAALALTGHIAIVALGIVLINMQERQGWSGWLYQKTRPILPPIVQFSFGGLFSGFFIFYSRSGSLAASWPLLLLLIGLLIGNEFFRQRYVRMAFQTSIFYIALFLYAVFVLPLLIRDMGTAVFLASGLASLGVALAFLYILSHLAPLRYGASRTITLVSIAGIFIGMNVLYFTNIMPPIPLSLRDAGVYHDVVRIGSEYRVTYEEKPWHRRYLQTPVYNRAPGEAVYVWTAIFAPAGLTANIVHEWQLYDEASERWMTTNTVAFPIHGGRDEGYRGYSLKSNATAGKWRVNVKTARGAIIGRVSFRIVEAQSPVPVQEKVL